MEAIMWIAIDEENQVARGPFSTEAKAVAYAHRLVLATGEIKGVSEHPDLDLDAVEEFMTSRLWKFMEVEYVEEDDHQMLDFTSSDQPHIVVQDDGGLLAGPTGDQYPTRQAALDAAIAEIAEPEDPEWTKAILLASNGQENLDRSREYRRRAEALNAGLEAVFRGDLEWQKRALQLIHDVDWIVTTPAVYAAERLED